jgi:hypothetical protein
MRQRSFVPESFRGGCSFGAGRGMVRTLPLTTGVEDRGVGGVVKPPPKGALYNLCNFDENRKQVRREHCEQSCRSGRE